MKKVIAICGFIGSGKGAVSDILVQNYGYRKMSFADSLKDAVAGIFNWPRHMLEGDTKESRDWREQVDTWWASRLKIPHLTPRWVLQQWGTEVARKAFHDDIWIASVENKLRGQDNCIVIPDCRFPNEIKTVRRLGGEIWWVRRGHNPEWFHFARSANNGQMPKDVMLNSYPDVHYSEWAWVSDDIDFDHIILNDGGLKDLEATIHNLDPV